MTSPASPGRAPGATLPGVATVATALLVGLTLLSPPASAVVAPGNFKGMGFDACAAPSTRTMNKWMRAKENPYRAVGVYISGSLRACSQPNLTRSWVRHQTKMGWHIIPITVGRQASCSGFSKRVSAKPAHTYAKARKQARAVAMNTVRRAQQLGLSKGSTLYYDMEAWHIGYTRCDAATLWFLSAWTKTVHRYGYAGGVYSSGASGIAKLDQMATKVAQGAKVARGYRLPDFIWFAEWNGKETIQTSYIKKSHWRHHQRIHQFLGGHNARNGGVTVNIDSNWLNVRTRGTKGGNKAVVQPVKSPTNTYACTRSSITRTSYLATSATKRPGLVGPLQCLLKQGGYYDAAVTGEWNTSTTNALHAFQQEVGIPVRDFASRRAWTALTVHSVTPATLRNGDSTPVRAVLALARSLNAAVGAGLHGTGYFGDLTEAAVERYQDAVLGRGNGIAGKKVWAALRSGRVAPLPSGRVAARTVGSDVPPATDTARPDATPSAATFTTASPRATPASSASQDPSPAPARTPSGTPSATATERPTPTERPAPTKAAPPVDRSPSGKPTPGAAEKAAASQSTKTGTHPQLSSAAGIKPPTRKAAPVRPAVLQARVPDMHPAAKAPARANPRDAAVSARVLLARQIPQVLSNLDIETTMACRLFFPWLEA